MLFLLALAAVALGSPAAAIVQRSTRSDDARPAQFRATVLRVAAPTSTPLAPAGTTTPLAPAAVPLDGWKAGFRSAVDRVVPAVEAARPYAVTVWSVGVLATGGALLTGSLSLRRLLREARPIEAIQPRARAIARRLRLRRIPSIGVHSRVDEPCLAGLFRPMILLPSRWLETAPSESTYAVLAHELAHARRFDHLANLAQRAIEACFFFHPCVHGLSRSARRASEHAADALAARLTGDPLALARALESVARLRTTRPRPSKLGLAIGGDRSTLLPRIQELLDMKPNRPRLALWPLAAIPAAFVAAIVTASVGLAQEPASKDVPAVPQVAAPPRVALPPSVPRSKISREERLRLTSSDPRKLSPEDREKLNSLDQIAYQVRIVKVSEKAWNRLAKDAFKPVETSNKREAWTLEAPALKAALDQILKDRETRELQAPTVTAYEESPVRIQSGDDGSVASGEVIDSYTVSVVETSTPKAVKPPDLNAVPGEFDVQLNGTRLAAGHRIDARVSNTIKRRSEPPQQAVPAEATTRRLVPTQVLVDRKVETGCVVPDGSSLILDAGPAVDVRPANAAGSRSRRSFVVITPLHILLEEEEAAAAPVPTAPPLVK
nr:M56 family metallopeptidase [Paludisphaera mucosa]